MKHNPPVDRFYRLGIESRSPDRFVLAAPREIQKTTRAVHVWLSGCSGTGDDCINASTDGAPPIDTGSSVPNGSTSASVAKTENRSSGHPSSVPTVVFVDSPGSAKEYALYLGTSGRKGRVHVEMTCAFPIEVCLEDASERMEPILVACAAVLSHLFDMRRAREAGAKLDRMVLDSNRRMAEMASRMVTSVASRPRIASSSEGDETSLGNTLVTDVVSLGRILDSLPQLVSYVDRDLVYRYVNHTYEVFFDVSAEEIVGRSVVDVIGERAKQDSDPQREVVFQGSPARFLTRARFEDGRDRDLDGVFVPDFDAHGAVVGYFSVLTDVTAYLQVQREMERTQTELRALTARLQTSREEERISLARDLHDSLAQPLTFLKMQVARLEQETPVSRDADRLRIAEIKAELDNSISLVRKLSTELRPDLLDDIGLAAAAEFQCERFFETFGVRCEFSNAQQLVLDDAVSIALFRVLQEALTNIARHAEARSVQVRLSRGTNTAAGSELSGPDMVVLEVEDDGVGPPDVSRLPQGANGIVGMRERLRAVGGTLVIQAGPDGGTKVIGRAPAGVGLEKGERLNGRGKACGECQ